MLDSLGSAIENPWFAYGALPVLIFLARVCDVSMATIRVLFIAKGQRLLAPAVGFFEVIVWLLAISQILQRLDNPLLYVAYAGGFATGTFVGMTIEGKLALGVVLVRVITRESGAALIERLKRERLGVTYLDAHGAKGTVQVIFSLVRRSEASKMIELIKQYNPKAFYSVEDVRFVSDAAPAEFRERFRQRWLGSAKRK